MWRNGVFLPNKEDNIDYEAKQNIVLIFQQYSIIMTRIREVNRRWQVCDNDNVFLFF